MPRVGAVPACACPLRHAPRSISATSGPSRSPSPASSSARPFLSVGDRPARAATPAARPATARRPRIALGGSFDDDDGGGIGIEEAYADADAATHRRRTPSRASRAPQRQRPVAHRRHRRRAIRRPPRSSPSASAAGGHASKARSSPTARCSSRSPSTPRSPTASTWSRPTRSRPATRCPASPSKHGVSMMTLWWANKLKSKDDLHQGQVLRIPPVSGLVVEVKPGQTRSTAWPRSTRSPTAKIIKTNGLEDQQPRRRPGPRPAGRQGRPDPDAQADQEAGRPSRTARSSGSGGSAAARPGRPRATAAATSRWPAPGGHISQYYHYGHYGLDIDGSTGDPIVAAAGGTVTFAGWKSNGGGYQVWIAHGSGLYTTYNHMSSVSVGRGQHVSQGPARRPDGRHRLRHRLAPPLRGLARPDLERRPARQPARLPLGRTRSTPPARARPGRSVRGCPRCSSTA